MMGRKKRFDKIVSNKELVSLESMRTALEKNNVEILGEDLDIVYT